MERILDPTGNYWTLKTIFMKQFVGDSDKKIEDMDQKLDPTGSY